MKRKTHFLLSLAVIFLIWLFASNEMYLFKTSLRFATAARYIIYTAWLGAVAATGFWFTRRSAHQWMQKAWISLYAAFVLLLLVLGVTDLFIVHFSHAQKLYIQNFRLFFQSPSLLVIFYLMEGILERQPGHSIA